MSTNLYFSYRKNNKEHKIDLYQTPSFITHICLSISNGSPDGGTRGVLHRYYLWIEHYLGDTRAFNEHKQRIERHIKDAGGIDCIRAERT